MFLSLNLKLLSFLSTLLFVLSVLSILFFILFGYISFKFLRFHYISSNNSVTEYDNYASQLLEKYGDDPILNVTIIKKRITLPVICLIMIADLPNFSPDKFTKLLKMSHIGILFHIKSNNTYDKHILIEKNNKIHITDTYSVDPTDKLLSFTPEKENKFTIQSVLDQTREKMGDLEFFNWNDFYKNNCQTFGLELLDTLKILNEERKGFIKDKFDIQFNPFTLYLFNQAIYFYSFFT
jgi:hypothetical protein